VTNEQNIFEGQDQGQTPAPKTEGDSLLTALVGDKQKYRSVEDLAKAYVNADGFIEQLKEENKKLREEVTKAKTVDEALQQLQQKQQEEQKPTPSETYTADDIAAIVDQRLSGMEVAKSREQNMLKADKLMREKFGEKATEVFNNVAIGPKRAVLTELAATDPDMFVALFESKVPVQATPDTGSFVAPPSGSSTADWSKGWVSEVRKKDPNRYYSQDFQVELQKRVIANPSGYFG
jgi:hypothetical protein